MTQRPSHWRTRLSGVVNAHMARALRVISIERGYDPRRCALVAFGGAGPLHAAALAEALDIREVIVPRYPGVLSAVGTALAEVERSYSRTVMLTVERGAAEPAAVAMALADAYADLERQASSELRATLGPVRLELRRSLDCRYQGQSHELLLTAGRARRVRAGGAPTSQAGDKPRAEIQALQAAVRSFDRLHRRRYGYGQADRAIEIVTIRLRARHLQPGVALPEAAAGSAGRYAGTSRADHTMGRRSTGEGANLRARTVWAGHAPGRASLDRPSGRHNGAPRRVVGRGGPLRLVAAAPVRLGETSRRGQSAATRSTIGCDYPHLPAGGC